jgi:hypothetical protein
MALIRPAAGQKRNVLLKIEKTLENLVMYLLMLFGT